jgi:hypothetical protein
MYQLVNQHRVAPLLLSEGGPALAALAVAEIFFKWKSFTLECAGFLVTWFAISWAWSLVLGSERALATGKAEAKDGQ